MPTVNPSPATLDCSESPAAGFPLSDFHRSGFRSERGRALARRFSLRRRPEARRHRAVARGQDRVHHRAGRQPDRRRPSCRCCAPPPKGASRAPISSRSPTTRCRASPTKSTLAALSGPDRRWPQSTRRISQLRLTIEFERAASWGAKASQPDARHRRLSRRMAARPAAARQVLRPMVARDDRGERGRRRARRSPRPGARFLPASTPPRRPRRKPRATAAELFTAYLAQGARRRLRALDPAAGPLPDAGRSRGIARPDLRAAAARRGSAKSRRARWRR